MFKFIKQFIKELYGTILFYIFRIFPLNKKIVFSCFHGMNYEGNPKYISDYLLKERKDIKQVWLNHSNEKFKLNPSIKVVKWGSLRMIYELATANVWVDTHTKPYWIKKRKKQFFIQTWHGGLGMKKIEADMFNLTKMMKRNIKHSSKMTDLFISNSKHLTNIIKNSFWYDGPIKEIGFPKNDIFYSPKEFLKGIKIKVKDELNLPDKKILLYAPTFRDNQSLDVYNINFEVLNKALKERFNEDFILLIKLHPRIKQLSEKMIRENKLILDVSNYDNMQELIIATDIFITDYSSGIFDFASLRRPGFLYATDIEEYKKERGLYYDLHTMPFPLAENNEQLYNNIIKFNEKDYLNKLEQFFIDMGLKDNANSTEKVAKIIEDYIDNGK